MASPARALCDVFGEQPRKGQGADATMSLASGEALCRQPHRQAGLGVRQVRTEETLLLIL